MNKKNVLIIFIVLAFVGILISIAIKGRGEENYLPDIRIHTDVADVGQEILIEQKEFDEKIEFYNDTILYLKDEQVDMLSEYTDFLEGKSTAYNNNLQKKQYFKEYYRDYVINQFGYIYGLQITSADLNGDEQQELLVIFMSHSDEGDLLVFENRDGKLYAWDIMENFFTMRVGSVYLRKDFR